MATLRVERAMLDTNILLSATDKARADHAAAVDVINRWPAEGAALYTSGQILREYLAVATRAAPQNGLGLTRAAGVANVRTLAGRMTLLTENAKVTERLLGLLDDVACTGKQVHDANVVATMLVHGVQTLMTLNEGDFRRFGEHVRVIGPHDDPSS